MSLSSNILITGVSGYMCAYTQYFFEDALTNLQNHSGSTTLHELLKNLPSNLPVGNIHAHVRSSDVAKKLQELGVNTVDAPLEDESAIKRVLLENKSEFG